MSFTSHAYHVAKDFQTFGAACLAFAAAGMTFYAQRWVANRQAQTTLEVLEKQIAEQKRKDDAKEAQVQEAFRIALRQACARLAIELNSLARAAEIFLERGSPEDNFVHIHEEDIAWTRFKSFGSFATSQPLFSMDFAEVAQADPQSQAMLLALMDRCGLVDRANAAVTSNFAAHGSVLKIYFEAVSSFASGGSSFATSCKEKISPTSAFDLVGPSRTGSAKP